MFLEPFCCLCLEIFLCKKYIFFLFCTLGSIAPLFDRSQTWAYARAHLRWLERKGPFHTHCAHLYLSAIERTHSEASHNPFLAHFLPFSPSFLTCAVHRLLHFPLIISHTSTPNHHSTAQTLSHHHHYTSIPPSHHRRRPHHSYFTPIFLFFHTKPNFSQKFTFCPHSLSFTRTNHENGLCMSFLCWIDLFLQGVGVDFKGGSQTLIFRGAHHVFDKIPQRVSNVPRGQVSASRCFGTQAMADVPIIEHPRFGRI